MAILMRRGADADFDASKIQSGELAVTTDGTEKIYVGFAKGKAKELVKKETFEAEVNKLSEQIRDLGGGLTAAQITALADVVNHIGGWTDDDGKIYVANFNTAFGITVEPEEPDTPVEPDEPEVPEVTLTSIKATYSGGDVAVGTALTDLTGIVVTAVYSDGTSKTVTDYTLSGEIAEGTNTITVSYNGKTTTITVIGYAEEEETSNTRKYLSRTLNGTYTNNGVTSVRTAGFSNLTSVTVADFASLSTINASGFVNCTSLTALILRNKTACVLNNSNVFVSTPIASGAGYIYVPSELVDTYKTANNWSNFANQFRAIEDYPDICGGE